MSTLDPVKPEPGWLLRWTVQSLQLAPRMGAAAVLMAAGVWSVGAAALLIESILTTLAGDSRLVQDAARAIATSLGVPVLLAMSAIFVQGDRGQSPDWPHVTALARSGMRQVFVVAVAIQLFMLTILGGWNNPGRPFVDNLGLAGGADTPTALAAAALGVDVFASTIALACFTCILSVPLVVGMGVDWAQATLFDKRLRATLPRVNRTLWTVLIVAGLTAVLAHPLVGFAILFFFALWIFVAAREIVGGIRSNGTLATAPDAQVQPSA